MSVNWQELVHAHYPAARPLKDAQASLRQLLKSAKGRYDGTLLATSFCPDDILASKDIGHEFLGPFNLGGMGALPMAGLTAMGAYAHHIPDDGIALIVYGPHIGLTPKGELGRMIRPGQSHETSSCGALMGALERFSSSEEDAPYVPFARDDDGQQVLLERTLMPYKSRILTAASPEKEITEITCALVHQQVHSLVDATRSQFCGSSIVFAGGLIINTDADQEDWVDLRYSGVIELRTAR